MNIKLKCLVAFLGIFSLVGISAPAQAAVDFVPSDTDIEYRYEFTWDEENGNQGVDELDLTDDGAGMDDDGDGFDDISYEYWDGDSWEADAGPEVNLNIPDEDTQPSLSWVWTSNKGNQITTTIEGNSITYKLKAKKKLQLIHDLGSDDSEVTRTTDSGFFTVEDGGGDPAFFIQYNSKVTFTQDGEDFYFEVPAGQCGVVRFRGYNSDDDPSDGGAITDAFVAWVTANPFRTDTYEDDTGATGSIDDPLPSCSGFGSSVAIIWPESTKTTLDKSTKGTDVLIDTNGELRKLVDFINLKFKN